MDIEPVKMDAVREDVHSLIADALHKLKSSYDGNSFVSSGAKHSYDILNTMLSACEGSDSPTVDCKIPGFKVIGSVGCTQECDDSHGIYELNDSCSLVIYVMPGMTCKIVDSAVHDVVIAAGHGSNIQYVSLVNTSNAMHSGIIADAAIASKAIPVQKSPKHNLIAVLSDDVRFDFVGASCSYDSNGSDSSCSIIMLGEGADSKYRCLSIAGNDERIAASANMFHLAKHTSSSMLTRAVHLGASKGAYSGRVKIGRESSGCIARQKHDTLLLGDSSRVDAMPILEVDNDDVVCSHGAAIGRLSDEQLFYLRSRGLDDAASRKIIIMGFFDQMLISMSDLGPVVKESISKKLEDDFRNQDHIRVL